MKTISAEEYKKTYGQDSYNRFSEMDSKRLGTTPSNPTTDTAGQDLSAGFSGAKDAFNRGADRVNTIESQGRGKMSELFGKFTNGVRTGGEALASLGSGVIRALPGGTTAMNTLESLANKTASAVSESKTVQDIAGTAKAGFEKLPEPAQRTITDVGNLALGGVQIAGALVIPGASSKVLSTVSENVSKKLESIPKTTFTIDTERAGDLINKYRAQLSKIDPKVETVLKKQKDPVKIMAYFDQAEKSAVSSAEPMATKLASDKAVEAYKHLDINLTEIGKAKAELLDSISTQKVPGNITGKAIDNVKNTIGERFGIEIDNKGNISQIKGRVASVDDKSQKLIAEYVSSLRSLGPSPTARQLDDFVDAMQRKLYKQSSPNLFEVADEPVISLLKQQTGEINNQLKTNVDQLLKVSGKDASYGALNAKYSSLLDTSEALNKRLGTEGDKGASLMKSLFSSQTGEPTRRLFQQIKDDTGIDLFEEATLAKFAMESVGDPRSKNLLQEIDALSGDVSKLNLMEPGSWLNAIREKADLDGRELAKVIISQANSTTSK